MANWFTKKWKNLSWDHFVKEILKGAQTGAGFGVDPLTKAIGAGSGALYGAAKAFYEGKATPEQKELLSQFAPELQTKIDEFNSGNLDRLKSDQFDFGPIRENAIKNFEEQGIPSIVERLHGLTGGAGSDVFDKRVGLARANLERNLAADQQRFNMQKRGQDINLLGLSRQHNTGQPAAGQGNMFSQLSEFAPQAVDILKGLMSPGSTGPGYAPQSSDFKSNMYDSWSPVSYGGR